MNISGLSPHSNACRALALLLCAVLLLPTAALAEEQNFGAYTVHYQAVNSTLLTPEIADQYGIVRSANGAFLNVAVLRNESDGSTTPVTATLNGTRHNLLQQSETLEFREIREGDAIYYIGQFKFSNAEIVRFTLEVSPEGNEPGHTIEWTTQLYQN